MVYFLYSYLKEGENVEFQIKDNTKKINEHEGRINTLEKETAVQETQIGQLVKSIDGLVGMLKWMIGLGITSLIPIFLYIVSNL